MTELMQLPEWKALQAHQKKWTNIHLAALFESDPQRFKTFSYRFNEHILFDFSKHYLTDETLPLLVALAKARKVKKNISDLFAGKFFNRSEGKIALHTALRSPNFSAYPEFSDNIIKTREKMFRFVRQIRSGEWKGYSGKAITDVVHIGVGGSLLGPAMVTDALSHYAGLLRVHFVSTLDGEQTTSLFTRLSPETTLIIVASKSFYTEETLSNAALFKAWFTHKTAQPTAYKRHFIGVSENLQAMTDFGLSMENQFELWDFVGGRYSVWSAIGLVIALAIGPERFSEFLHGAYRIDQHFQTAPLENNIPVIMALLTIWYRNFMQFSSQVVAPYSASLANFPAYLQQLEMESCGKHVTQSGKPVNYKTGMVVWGDVGSNGEHSFFQLLHQGSDIIPVDFIVPIRSVHNLQVNQDLVLTHALAQAQALMMGSRRDSLLSDSEQKQQQYKGNRPSTMILFPALTPEILGSLLACYEHKVFVQSAIWDINPFDQGGVALGKYLSKKMLSMFHNEENDHDLLDASTKGLLDFIQPYLKNDHLIKE